MKYLQRLLALVIVSAAIFSCQKEYSIENNGNPSTATAQWEFKEGGVQFKGPIDTVSVDTISGYKFLTINGRSDDGAAQFTLQAFGADLKVGTYKTPFSLFAYIKGTTPVYQTDQAAADSFTIVITRVDATGVAGTFSGRALSGTTGKAIVDGKFTAAIKTGTTTPPTTTDSGQVVLWSKAGCGGGTSTNPITVSVGTKSGQITTFTATEPTTCDPAGAFSLKLPVGSYPWVAKCGTDSVSGTVTVTKGGCTKQVVDFTASAALTDYFPITTNSNWSYLNEGSTPDDSLYVLSTGKTAGVGADLYSLFSNDYGAGGKDSSYYFKKAGSYYEYLAADSTGTTGLKHVFLMDNVAEGTVWSTPYSSTYNGTPVTGNIQDTLSHKLTTYTVNGKAYPDVLEVHSGYFLTLPAPLGKVQLYLIKQWFAKGVGLIKYYQYDGTTATPTEYTIDLTRYKVF